MNNNLACPVPDDWSMLTTLGKGNESNWATTIFKVGH
jgi:hypothetical protein